VIGDTIFAIGLFAFVWFVFSLDHKKRMPEHEHPETRECPNGLRPLA
jgi:nitric oxide reductase subunit B